MRLRMRGVCCSLPIRMGMLKKTSGDENERGFDLVWN